MSWLQPTQEDHKYVTQLKDDVSNVQLYKLLTFLSPALRIEPLLLRNARLHFVPDSDIELETTLWFSSAIHSRNAKAIVMHKGIARVLLDDLEQNVQDYEQAFTFINHQTRHWSSQDKLEQKMRLAARSEDADSLKEDFKQVLATLFSLKDKPTEQKNFVRWIRGAMPTLTSDQEINEEAQLVYQCIAASISSPERWPQYNDKPSSIPSWLLQALPTSPETTIGLQMRTGLLEILPADQAKHNLTLNRSLPTHIHLGFNGDEAESRWEPIWLGKIVNIPLSTQRITLHTLDGKQWSLQAKLPSKNNAKGISNNPPDSEIYLIFVNEDKEKVETIAKWFKQHGITINTYEDNTSTNIIPSNHRDKQKIIRLWSSSAQKKWSEPETGSELQLDSVLLCIEDIPIPTGTTNVEKIFNWNDHNKSDEIVNFIRAWSQDIKSIEPDIFYTIIDESRKDGNCPDDSLVTGGKAHNGCYELSIKCPIFKSHNKKNNKIVSTLNTHISNYLSTLILPPADIAHGTCDSISTVINEYIGNRLLRDFNKRIFYTVEVDVIYKSATIATLLVTSKHVTDNEPEVINKYFHSVSIKTGIPIFLKDILSGRYKSLLKDKSYLHKISYTNLDYQEIQVSDNFGITERGLLFGDDIVKYYTIQKYISKSSLLYEFLQAQSTNLSDSTSTIDQDTITLFNPKELHYRCNQCQEEHSVDSSEFNLEEFDQCSPELESKLNKAFEDCAYTEEVFECSNCGNAITANYILYTHKYGDQSDEILLEGAELIGSYDFEPTIPIKSKVKKPRRETNPGVKKPVKEPLRYNPAKRRKKPNIFISHYGKDDRHIQSLKQRFKDQGYNIRNSSIDSTKHEYRTVRPSDRTVSHLLRKGISWAGTFICLIGSRTHTRDWVNYEIRQAHLQGKTIVGIYTHGSKDSVQLPEAFKKYGGPVLGWNSLDKLGDAMAGKDISPENPDGTPKSPLYKFTRIKC